jgi:Flp pilus assembly protein TadG
MRWTQRAQAKQREQTSSMAGSRNKDSSWRDSLIRVQTHHVSRGQILILFAGVVIAMIGVLGLASDLGYAFAQRRTMQNAADAGAIAGAHAISKSNPASPSRVQSDVQQTALSNNMGNVKPTVTYCQYVDNTDKELGQCTDPVPASATGVHVTVKETHGTFFIGMVPGGPRTLSTNATATAHVQKLKGLPSDGPFLVCGIGADIDSGPGNGNKMDIVLGPDASGNWALNPLANGVTFQIHGPQSSLCNAQSSRYKGIADNHANLNHPVPGWLTYTTGDTAGQVAANVLGINGCKANVAVNNCIAFLPIAVGNPPETNNSKQLWTVVIAPFYIVQIGSSGNTHDGTLIENYVVDGSGDPSWSPNYKGPIVIRLTK